MVTKKSVGEKDHLSCVYNQSFLLTKDLASQLA